MRATLSDGDNHEFANYLLKIGEGDESIMEEVNGESLVPIPPEIVSKSKTLHEFCKEIFPRLRERVESGLKNQCIHDDQEWIDWLMSRAIIVPVNEDAYEANDLLMKQLSGEEMIYKSADKVLNAKKKQGGNGADPDIVDELKFPTEYLNSVNLPSMPPHRLVLKPGAPIMVIRNLDPQNGHANGARYIVKSLHNHVIHAQLAIGNHKGKDILLPRIYFNPQNTPFQFMQRKQFPVKSCFAITSNKSQAQTLSKVGIYLKREFFVHGQLYVAMSRVGSFKDLKVFKPSTNKTVQHMKNVVYKAILK